MQQPKKIIRAVTVAQSVGFFEPMVRTCRSKVMKLFRCRQMALSWKGYEQKA